MENHYNNEEEIEAVVTGFEQCTTAKDEFTHLSHLTVATYYLRCSTRDEALQKMRSGLFRFLDHHGIDRAKYDEQLTLAWLELTQKTVAEMNPESSLVEVTNAVLERLGKSRITLEVDRETL